MVVDGTIVLAIDDNFIRDVTDTNKLLGDEEECE